MAKLIPAPPASAPPPNPDATSLTLSGPNSGLVGSASLNYTVGVLPVGGTISGTMTVTPSDSSGGGTFSPTTLTFVTGDGNKTFTYTPGSAGTKNISITNDKGLANPSSLSYVASSSATVPTAPLIGSANTGYSFVDVYFSPPTSDGGSAIIDYYAVLSTGESNTGSGSPIRITVPNGVSRSATVRARNAIGNSAFSGTSNTVTPPPTVLSFTSNQTWVCPSGVSNLIIVTGKGQDGTPGTSGTTGSPTSHSLIVANVTYDPTPGGGNTRGAYNWSTSQGIANNASYVVNNGGTGTFNTSDVTSYAYDRTSGGYTYDVSQGSSSFNNSIPNSASLSYSPGWQSSGGVTTSGYATLSWQEYGATTPGTPATTGASTTGFGITWAGGVGGTSATASYNNISVTAGASYGIVVPSGGYVQISY